MKKRLDYLSEVIEMEFQTRDEFAWVAEMTEKQVNRIVQGGRKVVPEGMMMAWGKLLDDKWEDLFDPNFADALDLLPLHSGPFV